MAGERRSLRDEETVQILRYRRKEFQDNGKALLRETINNDEIVKSVSPLGSSMFIIEIDRY